MFGGIGFRGKQDDNVEVKSVNTILFFFLTIYDVHYTEEFVINVLNSNVS